MYVLNLVCLIFQDEVVDWANYADSRDKIYLVKCLLNLMGNEELGCVKAIMQRRRRREKEDCRLRQWKGPGRPSNAPQDDLAVRNPASAVTTPAKEGTFIL